MESQEQKDWNSARSKPLSVRSKGGNQIIGLHNADLPPSDTAAHSPLDNPVIQRRISYYPRLQRVIRYLNEHLTETVRLKELASIAGMEKTAFSRFFRRTVGIASREFINQWRISLAIERMLVSEHTLTELAHDSGFSSIYSFERAVKKLTGVTPSAYRKSLLIHARIISGHRKTKTGQFMKTSGQ
jgi:AraC-like DNA-binding protein